MNNKEEATVPETLRLMAAELGTEIEHHQLHIPQQYGTGFCAGYVFNENLSMIVMNYELKDDLLLDLPSPGLGATTLLFKFLHFSMDVHQLPAISASYDLPRVLITTSSMRADPVTIHSNKATINVEVNADYLRRQFSGSQRSTGLQGLLENTQALFFEQLAPASLQKVIGEMLSSEVHDIFRLFHLRIKAEELLCMLLMKLEQRNETRLYTINATDLKSLYNVRDRMLEYLEMPPVIKELSAYAGMSPTKLKQLFKQIFGYSIYNYYQHFRMKKAASLLVEEKLSVSEAGYTLGFSNLSHFSRVFEAHWGMKPKKYAANAMK